MVRYKIATEEEKAPAEIIHEVSLEGMDDGRIALLFDEWYVATLTEGGCLRLSGNLPDDIDLQITEAGYIKVLRET